MKAPTPADRESIRHRTVIPRFRDAFLGFYRAYREEPNLRFHIFAGACVAFAAYAVRVEVWEWAYLAVTITLVLFAEMVNTAVERAVDLASGGRRQPLAAMAKEVAAGGVLLAALHATVAAVALFLVRRSFGETLAALLDTLMNAPWLALAPVVAGALALVGGSGQDTGSR